MEGLLREKFKIGYSMLRLECQICEAGGGLCSLRSGHAPSTGMLKRQLVKPTDMSPTTDSHFSGVL
jgi:hypothetical protein